MQPSSAKVITSLSGEEAPTSPSVDPNASMTGTPKPAEIAARSSGDRDGFETKTRAVELLGQQYDAAMLRLQAPVCAAE